MTVTQSTTLTLTLTIRGALIITSVELPDGIVGELYSAKLSASGGVLPYFWEASGLPEGLSMDMDGVLSGVPREPGTFAIEVRVRDSSGGY